MLPKTGKVLRKSDGSEVCGLTYAAAVAFALHDELGESHRGLKVVMRWTGASERTAKNWFAGTRGPTGEHLVSLVRHSDAVLTVLLRLAGREALLVTASLIEARSKLTDILVAIDDLLSG